MLKESSYLIGKDERICDILAENPSISRQHAVLQFRKKYQMEMDGSYLEKVIPYLMDLESTNGTKINEEKLEPTRYYELMNKDVLKFGFSEREYVLVEVEN